MSFIIKTKGMVHCKDNEAIRTSKRFFLSLYSTKDLCFYMHEEALKIKSHPLSKHCHHSFITLDFFILR
jgi:hypothetical protein